MAYKNHIAKYNNSQAIQDALDNGTLANPYVAMTSAGTLDYNTLEPTPPAPTTMGVWSDNGQGVYTFQITETGTTYWENPTNIGSLDGVYFQSEDPMDIGVAIYYDMSWTVELSGEGLSDSPSQAFADGTPDTWLQESVMTDPNESSASLEVSWDGVDTFTFQRYTDGSGPALQMTTINPEYPAGE